MSTPLLRFSDFDAAWVEMPLNDFAVRITQRNNVANQNVLTISAVNGLVTQTDYFNNSVASKDLGNYYFLQRGDFAYNKSYSNGYPWGAIKRLSNYDTGVVSPLYICFRISEFVNHDFVSQMFESDKHHNELSSIAKEGARNHGLLNIGINDFFSITFSLPSLEEQQKIADFLSSVDQKIELLTKKKAHLEKYKKGVMQQLFSQTIRFKDDDGSDFPEWESQKLGDISQIRRGASPRPISDPKWFEKGSNIGWVRISDVSRSSKYLYFTEQEVSVAGKAKSVFVGEGNIIMSICGTIGLPIILRNNVCIHDGFVVFQNLEIQVEYLYYFLNYFRSNWLKYGQPGTQVNLNTDIVANETISIPSLPEQQKIADFLSAIDRKIELISEQIEKTKLFKKGLLQQMFV